MPIRVSPIPLDDLTFVSFGDCGWGVGRDGSSQGGSLIIAADERILDGFEATTTMVDWKSYKCKRVVRSSLAGETQAYVETLDMLEFTKVFEALFLDPWYDALEKSESSTRNLAERRTTIEVTAI